MQTFFLNFLAAAHILCTHSWIGSFKYTTYIHTYISTWYFSIGLYLLCGGLYTGGGVQAHKYLEQICNALYVKSLLPLDFY